MLEGSEKLYVGMMSAKYEELSPSQIASLSNITAINTFRVCVKLLVDFWDALFRK